MTVQITTRPTLGMAFQGLPFIQTLDRYYPDIQHWFVNKAIPGIFTGDDQLIIAHQQRNIIGVCLGKKSTTELKLRCVRVHPDYQHHGLGIRLIDQMLEQLDCRYPSATVAEELFHQYSRLFHKRYGFSLSDVLKGEYRRGKLEYHYNG